MSRTFKREFEVFKTKDRRIALVNPSYSNYLYGCEGEVKSVHPPLNLLYLHSYIRDYTEAKLFDGETYSNLEDLVKDVINFDPLIVGYTATSPTYPVAKNIAEKLRNPKLIQVIGGPYATVVPNEVLNYFDIAVIGEGEEALLDLIQNKKWDSIDGIAFKTKEGRFFTKKRPFRKNLDELPFPSWEIIDFTKYRCSLHRGENKKSAPIITSRGCPYNCTSCSTRLVNGKFVRNRTPKNVSEEMDLLVKAYGIRHFNFLVDTFTFNKRRLESLCDEIQKRKVTFSCNTRPDVFQENDAELLRISGCTNIFFGVESGNNGILEYFGRRMSKQKIRNSFKYCEQKDIRTTASFMIGSPYETNSTLKETLDFVHQLKPDFVLFNILTPHKGTRIYNHAVSEGILQPYEVDLEKFSEEPVGIPTIENKNISREELQQWKRRMYKDYYGSSNFIENQLRRAIKRGSFKNLKTALKLRKIYTK